MDAYFIKYNLNDTENTDLITATILDPLYKELSFVPSSVSLSSYHSAVAKQIETQTKNLVIQTSKEPGREKKDKLSFRDLAGKGQTTLTASLKELKIYLSIPAGGNFTKFYQSFGATYPRLAFAALKFLLPPATSVPVERVFSHCAFQVDIIFERVFKFVLIKN